MRSARPSLVLAVALLPLGACAVHDDDGGYGHVDAAVLHLYDEGAPDGTMELEIDRTGRIYEAEADVAPAAVPAAVMSAAMARAGAGATVTGAEIEYGPTGRTYEVKFERDGKGMEFVVDASGTIVETEREIDRSEAPAAVITAALAALPGDFKSVEVLHLPDGTQQYHVKTMNGGAGYKAVLRPDGTLVRAVREARAEIEIPLR